MNKNFEIISASAGTGKTHRLMEIVEKLILSGSLKPEELVAVTYTKKAATEIRSRVRQKLLESGKVDLAYAMQSARIGTVHAICAELLSQFAYEMGVSPQIRVLDEEEGELLFRNALSESYSELDLEAITKLAQKFNTLLKDLLDDAKKLCDLARQNNISSDQIIDSIPESIKTISQILPKAGSNKDKILIKELEEYCKTIHEPTDSTKKTEDAHNAVKKALTRLKQGSFTWKEWVELSELSPGKKSEHLFEKIVKAASEFPTHLGLHEDIKAVIELVLSISAKGLKLFEEKKKSLGVIDYGDMESQTLQLLNISTVRAKLKNEIKVLLVDEFQDSNPIQLSIFTKLIEICDRTVWVGDSKQSIYGFNGADPILMQNVLAQVADSDFEILSNSYRSCDELVEFDSSLFEKAFKIDGYSSKEVRVKAEANIKSKLMPIQIWKLTGKNVKLRFAALAAQIIEILKSEVPITERGGSSHPVRPNDIAILARSNSNCSEIVSQLNEYGLSASFSAGHLMSQPEIILVLSAFKSLIDPNDSLAKAQLTLLMDGDHDEWFKSVIQREDSNLWCEAIKKINELRDKINEYSPSELLNIVISILKIDHFIETKNKGDERLAHLSAIRAQAIRYEERCAQFLKACTPIGFLSYMSELEANEEDKILSWSRPDAIEVCTYHKAKGLEWPIVILTGTDASDRGGNLFGPRIVGPEKNKFDIKKPLENRALRYLPWPFGKKIKVEPVDQKLLTDPEVIALTAQQNAENRRLLYVGMTRAREQLVFALPEKFKIDSGTWLGGLQDAKGNPLLSISDSSSEILVDKTKFDCEVLLLEAKEIDAIKELPKMVLENIDLKNEFCKTPLYLQPSAQAASSEAEIGEKISLQGKITLTTKADEKNIGEAIHLFLASDELEKSKQDRFNHAKSIIKNWSLDNSLKPEDLLEASDRLNNTVLTKWPKSKITKEIPICHQIENSGVKTYLNGTIDYLIETNDEVIIIDHKSTNIPETVIAVRAEAHSGQLKAYASAVAAARKGKKVSTWLHFPLAGVLAEVVVNK